MKDLKVGEKIQITKESYLTGRVAAIGKTAILFEPENGGEKIVVFVEEIKKLTRVQ